jgi:adsorption protein B
MIAAPEILMDAGAWLASIQGGYADALGAALLVLAIVYLLSGLDDLLIDALYWLRAFRRATWKRDRIRSLPPETLTARTEQPVAIMRQLWQKK